VKRLVVFARGAKDHGSVYRRLRKSAEKVRSDAAFAQIWDIGIDLNMIDLKMVEKRIKMHNLYIFLLKMMQSNG